MRGGWVFVDRLGSFLFREWSGIFGVFKGKIDMCEV